MPEIAAMDVEIRAKVDQFNKGLETAQKKVTEFNGHLDQNSVHLKKFETDSSLAGKAITAFATVIDKVKAGLTDLQQGWRTIFAVWWPPIYWRQHPRRSNGRSRPEPSCWLLRASPSRHRGRPSDALRTSSLHAPSLPRSLGSYAP
jgi:hypothetical protein